MNISVVIPFFNEYESLPELYDWLKDVLVKNRLTYEIIFVDDGSNDDSWELVEDLIRKEKYVKGIKFRRNHGKSAALHVAFEQAKGDVIITMDADMQDSPDEIPGLYKMIVEDGYDLVSGWKKKRYDPIMKTLPSKFFNRTARMVSGIKLHDFNCGLKSYRNNVVKSIEVYGEMHRYIPILAKQAGFGKIGEKVVEHRARKYGVTKFGLDRFVKGFLDLLSIHFITKFGKRPMHLFGALGSFMFMLGLGISLYLGIDKLFFDTEAKLLASRTEFFIALVSMIMGVQMFLTGFLGELVSRSGSDRNTYHVAKTIFSNNAKIDEFRNRQKENKGKRPPLKRRPPAKKQETVKKEVVADASGKVQQSNNPKQQSKPKPRPNPQRNKPKVNETKPAPNKPKVSDNKTEANKLTDN